MKIHYETMEEMAAIVHCLVISGLMFNVTTSTKTIELTGGY
jgi:hypothetical protein